MRTVLATLAIATAALCAASEASAQEGMCSKPTGTVRLLLLPNKAKVHEYAKRAGHIPIVAQDASTVVFEDGRVVSSDAASVNKHLNELGWAEHRLEVVASFVSRRPRPRRAAG